MVESAQRGVAVVTGASRGLGRSIAERLSRDGFAVVAGARSFSNAATRLAAGEITHTNLDVTDDGSVERLFESLDALGATPDVLIVNAGIGAFGPAHELSVQQFRDVVATNLVGAFACMRAALVRMRASGRGGHVVVVGSVADRVALPDCAAYGASKFGLRGLAGVVAEEGATAGVRCTLLSLGAVATEIWRTRPEFDMKDMLEPEAVADVVSSVLAQPPSVRLDEVHLMPKAGLLRSRAQ